MRPVCWPPFLFLRETGVRRRRGPVDSAEQSMTRLFVETSVTRDPKVVVGGNWRCLTEDLDSDIPLNCHRLRTGLAVRQ